MSKKIIWYLKDYCSSLSCISVHSLSFGQGSYHKAAPIGLFLLLDILWGFIGSRESQQSPSPCRGFLVQQTGAHTAPHGENKVLAHWAWFCNWQECVFCFRFPEYHWVQRCGAAGSTAGIWTCHPLPQSYYFLPLQLVDRDDSHAFERQHSAWGF